MFTPKAGRFSTGKIRIRTAAGCCMYVRAERVSESYAVEDILAGKAGRGMGQGAESSTDAFVTTVGSSGTSDMPATRPVLAFAISSITAIPSTISPKTA